MSNAQYNITSSNNTLVLNRNGVSYTLTLTSGNYNVNLLVSALNTAIAATAIGTGTVLSYSNITNLFTYTDTTYSNNILINATSTMFTVLGFPTGSNIAASALTLSSSQIPDLCPNKSFYFCTQLPTENIQFLQSSSGKTSTVLAKVQLQSDQNGINYRNYVGFKSKIYVNRIDVLHINLYNDDLSSFTPGLDWTATLEFSFYENPDLLNDTKSFGR